MDATWELLLILQAKGIDITAILNYQFITKFIESSSQVESSMTWVNPEEFPITVPLAFLVINGMTFNELHEHYLEVFLQFIALLSSTFRCMYYIIYSLVLSCSNQTKVSFSSHVILTQSVFPLLSSRSGGFQL